MRKLKREGRMHIVIRLTFSWTRRKRAEKGEKEGPGPPRSGALKGAGPFRPPSSFPSRADLVFRCFVVARTGKSQEEEKTCRSPAACCLLALSGFCSARNSCGTMRVGPPLPQPKYGDVWGRRGRGPKSGCYGKERQKRRGTKSRRAVCVCVRCVAHFLGSQFRRRRDDDVGSKGAPPRRGPPLPLECGRRKPREFQRKKDRARNRIRSPRRPVFCQWTNAIKGSRQSCRVSSVDSMAPRIVTGDRAFLPRLPLVGKGRRKKKNDVRTQQTIVVRN